MRSFDEVSDGEILGIAIKGASVKDLRTKPLSDIIAIGIPKDGLVCKEMELFIEANKFVIDQDNGLIFTTKRNLVKKEFNLFNVVAEVMIGASVGKYPDMGRRDGDAKGGFDKGYIS